MSWDPSSFHFTHEIKLMEHFHQVVTIQINISKNKLHQQHQQQHNWLSVLSVLYRGSPSTPTAPWISMSARGVQSAGPTSLVLLRLPTRATPASTSPSLSLASLVAERLRTPTRWSSTSPPSAPLARGRRIVGEPQKFYLKVFFGTPCRKEIKK